jgi:hypothetical protein
MIVLTHVCEAHHFFPWMGWGLKHSLGHYVDLFSAILGLTLLPAGFLIRRPATVDPSACYSSIALSIWLKKRRSLRFAS